MTPAVVIVPPVIPPACAMRHDCTPAQAHDMTLLYGIVLAVIAGALAVVLLAGLWASRPNWMRRRRDRW